MSNLRKTYPYNCSVEALYQLVTDPDFLRERCEACGDRMVSVERREVDDAIELSSVREARGDVPRFARRLVKSGTVSRIRETWHLRDARAESRVEIDVQGLPITLSAEVVIEPTDSGCAQVSTYSVQCGVPLIGKKLAAYVLTRTEEGLDRDAMFNREWLQNASPSAS
ncbi:MAG: DUF2505 domain-containing protein [Planctomycetota bacterium]